MKIGFSLVMDHIFKHQLSGLFTGNVSKAIIEVCSTFPTCKHSTKASSFVSCLPSIEMGRIGDKWQVHVKGERGLSISQLVPAE